MLFSAKLEYLFDISHFPPLVAIFYSIVINHFVPLFYFFMAQRAINCSKLTTETLEQGVEYVQS